jgi:hypothetical protein
MAVGGWRARAHRIRGLHPIRQWVAAWHDSLGPHRDRAHCSRLCYHWLGHASRSHGRSKRLALG